MSVFDTSSEESREEALDAAVTAVRDGKLIVLPTDTVYGIGADAFSPQAVDNLLYAKGRGRTSPPPVLVGDHAVLMALAVDLPDYVEDLADAFWPGALTLVLRAQPSLSWDLGETRGTVALRMPDEEVALELLRKTGPLAVSSANKHGRAAATTILEAATQLGDSVEVYLDGGTSRGGVSSTIIDTTVEPAAILREGAISREEIVAVVGDIFSAPEPETQELDEDTALSKEPASVTSAATREGDDEPTSGSEGEVTPGASAATKLAPETGDADSASASGILDLPSENDIPSEEEPVVSKREAENTDG